MDTTLLDRIQKLLSKTEENGCTEAEAATAFALASRIMAEHGLAMAEVLAHDPDALRYGGAAVHESARRDFAHDGALEVVARYFNVRGTILRRPGAVAYVLFGTREDFEAARFVFGRIVDCCEAGWDRFRAREGAPPTARKSYTLGFLCGVESRIAMQRAALDAGQANALARVDDALGRAFDQALGSIPRRETRSLAPVEGDAHAAATGLDDGMQAAINREIETR